LYVGLRMFLSLLLRGEHLFPSFNNNSMPAGLVMRTYFFDMKGGVPSRDRTGLEFSTSAGAIEHSKQLSRRLRHEPRLRDRTLTIVVIDESGTEIHREQVHSGEPNFDVALGQIG
jgi:hypothetical protein